MTSAIWWVIWGSKHQRFGVCTGFAHECIKWRRIRQHANTLCGTTEHANTLCGTTEHANTLCGTTKHANTLCGTTQHANTLCGTTQHANTLCGTTQHANTLCGTTQHANTLCGTTQHANTLCSTTYLPNYRRHEELHQGVDPLPLVGLYRVVLLVEGLEVDHCRHFVHVRTYVLRNGKTE